MTTIVILIDDSGTDYFTEISGEILYCYLLGIYELVLMLCLHVVQENID